MRSLQADRRNQQQEKEGEKEEKEEQGGEQVEQAAAATRGKAMSVSGWLGDHRLRNRACCNIKNTAIHPC